MKSLYGFAKPYDFTRAVPFLGAVVLLCLVAISMAAFAAAGTLSWGSYRFYYFIYLALLAVAAAALSFLPRFAWALIALCFIELSFGAGSSALSSMKLASRSFMPLDSDRGAETAARRFQYHPLLQATLIPNYTRPAPFAIHHDSQGLRGAERVPALLKSQIVIATLGGSATYDIGVPDGSTWSDFLERSLGPRYAVLNHGVPGYSTVENLVQTIFYLDAYDVRPRCAIYYVGWNDTRNAHLPHLDPAYADFHLLSQLDNLQVRRPPNPLASRISPLARLLIDNVNIDTDPVPRPQDFTSAAPKSGPDARLEAIFRANLRAIATINKDRNITSIFVGQILNRAKLDSASRYGWYPLVRDMDVWPLQDRFNQILKETAGSIGAPSFVPNVDDFADADFVDNGHFSQRGSEKFAAMLAPLVRASCGN
jgi:hypothetical protein